MTMSDRERIDFDVLFVGGGPANLAGAIRLLQLARDKELPIEVAVIDKGAEIGAHALSGAVLNPRALAELLPDYHDRGCPLEGTVRADGLYYLTAEKHYRLPYLPAALHNTGFHVISAARFTRWLAQVAEELGANIFPGFAGTEVLYGPDGRTVVGVRTGDKGLDKEGRPKANHEPGIDLMAKVTVFGEGARGSLVKTMGSHLALWDQRLPQVFETGVKEVIQLPEKSAFGTTGENVVHTLGYPLGLHPPGGGFVYAMQANRVALGFLVSLGYADARLDLYNAFTQFKRHPFIAGIIRGGRVLEQGARTVPVGGIYTLPRLAVDGAVFVGACAGFHNTLALKGLHVGMKSGMLAAETVFQACRADRFDAATLDAYPRAVRNSWLQAELQPSRNTAQALARRMPAKLVHLAAQHVTGGRGLVDPMPSTPDSRTLSAVRGDAAPAVPPDAFDGHQLVDKLTGVYLSKTVHREDQPCHLVIHDTELCIRTCHPTYGAPCTRFCPGDVYAIETDPAGRRPRLKLNPANCLHCKTCDVKDPFDNITWTCPEGGEGPGYTVV